MTKIAAFKQCQNLAGCVLYKIKFPLGFATIMFAATLSFWQNSYADSFFSSRPRNYVNIVGSSTVYPFTATIAEKFGKRYRRFRTPTVEATGTGGGMKLFCSGIGHKYPDFVNASRKIKASEVKNCRENGINKISEIKIGYDGIVLANSIEGKKINLSKTQLFFALASKIPQNGKLVPNPITNWSQIHKSLPDQEIRIYGPPPTSGTRDAFVELVMEDFCVKNKIFKAKYPNKKVRKKICHTIRSDGHFIEAGENDNLILQKLRNDSEAFGIFGYSFVGENKNTIQAATINYIEPNSKTIASSKYKISRPLFIYFKQEHLPLIKGMKEFVQTILSQDAIGQEGYLTQKGLIPLSNYKYSKMRAKILKEL